MNARNQNKPFILLLGTAFVWLIVLLIIIAIAAFISELSGAGEQNIPAWILIAIFYNPVVLIGAVFALYVMAYLYYKVPNSEKEWPEFDTAEYEKDRMIASKYISNPERIDVYAKTHNLSRFDIKNKIGTGALRGYVVSGKTFIENT